MRERQAATEYVRPVVMRDQQVASSSIGQALIVVLVEVQHARAMRYLVSPSRPESSFALSRPTYAQATAKVSLRVVHLRALQITRLLALHRQM